MPYLDLRTIQSTVNEVQSVPDTFSSFDKCMQKNYCKYPFIVGCVIGGLILLSCLFCLIQCLCCGVACCKCCCGGCGGRSKSGKTKHVHHYDHAPPAAAAYRPPPAYTSQQPAHEREAPQFATFDKNPDRDTLPAMPSWQQAEEAKIEKPVPADAKDAVELTPMNGQGRYAGGPPSPVPPVMAGGAYAGSGRDDVWAHRREPSPQIGGGGARDDYFQQSNDGYGGGSRQQFAGQRTSPGSAYNGGGMAGGMGIRPARGHDHDSYPPNTGYSHTSNYGDVPSYYGGRPSERQQGGRGRHQDEWSVV